jgi:hypothetical protein
MEGYHMLRSAILAMCFALSACTTTYTQPRPQDYEADQPGNEASLFSSDSQVLSDADIARVLDHKYTAPRQMRIAILPFGWSTWSGWSEQMAVATETIDQQMIAALRASPRIYDASFVPSILIPEKRSVPYLREAAARYQADLLLAFRSRCQSFERYRFLQANKTKAFCTVEAVLLDVRTGLVPFVVTSTQNFEAVENKQRDLNFRETILRSQLEALGIALGEVSKSLVRFVERAQPAA